jgi:hypothetical protein
MADNLLWVDEDPPPYIGFVPAAGNKKFTPKWYLDTYFFR